MGDQDPAGTGRGLLPAQAADWLELAHGRDLHTCGSALEVLVPSCRPRRRDSHFLLTTKRDVAAARRFLERAIARNGVPEKITIDRSGANTAAIEGLRAASGADIELRRSNYLNNIVEQDHLAIKRIVRPMMGSKSFWCAVKILAGIETMHMIR